MFISVVKYIYIKILLILIAILIQYGFNMGLELFLIVKLYNMLQNLIYMKKD